MIPREAEACPVPVGDHYVRLLLLSSSCFAMDRESGKPNVCGLDPCACAQSLLDEISKPLLLKIARLRLALEAIFAIEDEQYGNDWAEIEAARQIARAALQEVD